jgi:hypothetical protein
MHGGSSIHQDTSRSDDQGAFLYGYDSGVMGGVLAMDSFKRSFGLLGEDPVTLANHNGRSSHYSHFPQSY